MTQNLEFLLGLLLPGGVGASNQELGREVSIRPQVIGQ
jgi:hypothetical protein